MRRFELGAKFWEIDTDGPRVLARWGEVGDVKTKATAFPTAKVAQGEAEKLIAKVTKLGYRPSASAAEAAQLEKAILKDLHDPRAWQVYGDFLAERGDVRGELAGLVASKPDRVTAFVITKASQLFGALAPLQRSRAFEARSWSPGFIGHLHVDIDRIAVEGKDVKAVLALPVCALIHGFSSVSSRPDNWQHSLKQLAASPQAQWLETLEFEGEEGASVLGDVSESLPKFRALRALRIRARQNDLGALDLPNLVELVREGGDWRQEEARSITKAKLPALQKLTLGFGTYEEDIDVAQLVTKVLKRKSLRTLAIAGATFDSDMTELLLEGELIDKLRALDLSGSYVTDDAAGLFYEHRDTLTKLKKLVLPEIGDSESSEPMELGLEDEDDADDDESEDEG